MRKRKLIWQLYPSYLIIILLSLFAVSWYTAGSVRQFFLDRTRADLETQGRVLSRMGKRNVQSRARGLALCPVCSRRECRWLRPTGGCGSDRIGRGPVGRSSVAREERGYGSAWCEIGVVTVAVGDRATTVSGRMP